MVPISWENSRAVVYLPPPQRPVSPDGWWSLGSWGLCFVYDWVAYVWTGDMSEVRMPDGDALRVVHCHSHTKPLGPMREGT